MRTRRALRRPVPVFVDVGRRYPLEVTGAASRHELVHHPEDQAIRIRPLLPLIDQPLGGHPDTTVDATDDRVPGGRPGGRSGQDRLIPWRPRHSIEEGVARGYELVKGWRGAEARR